jgi:hypothetical protein
MPAQFSLGHNLMIIPAQLLMFFDHSFVEFLCAQVRLVHYRHYP